MPGTKPLSIRKRVGVSRWMNCISSSNVRTTPPEDVIVRFGLVALRCGLGLGGGRGVGGYLLLVFDTSDVCVVGYDVLWASVTNLNE